MRWLIGWDRNLGNFMKLEDFLRENLSDAIIPRITTSIRTCNALGLNKKEMETIEKVSQACDDCHETVRYMPGEFSLIYPTNQR